MFNNITAHLSSQWALLRSLSPQSRKRIMFLIITSSVLPIALAFVIVSLILSTVFNINTLTIWALIPAIIGVSISRILYYAKRFSKQEHMAKQTAR